MQPVVLAYALGVRRVERGGGPLAKLIYSAIASLDGYIADEEGNFDWAEPDEEVHTFINGLERPVGTYLFGRRLYEVMAAWENPEAFAAHSSSMRDFAAIWRAAEKIVYSRTLQTVSTQRTRLEREFEPKSVGQLKSASERDLAIGGPTLAAEAFRAGLVDDCHLFLVPVAVGGGTAAFPLGLRVDLELVGERRFRNDTVHLRYRTRP